MKKILKQSICYLWQHKIAYNDNGCDVCGRCGRHEYYDDDFYNGKPFFKMYFWFRHKFRRLKFWYEFKILNRLPF